MNRRCARLVRRSMLVIASWPLLQAAGCGADFFATAIANQTANEVAGALGVSLETVLMNLFGV